ncbi:MAG: T9SS type B sorting domain-containing protein [Bacteroidetes bacterium]|nr:T9SS type B sorting domain-containing protein [Bacteroidota bacterium]
MKRTLLACLATLLALVSNAQTFQLFFETFEGSTSIFDLNTASLGGSTGPNRWVINDQYLGGGIYPRTPSQDSTYFGTINAAPNSRYLHIADSGTPAVQNANYDPTAASDAFAEIPGSYCTLGLTDVTFTFFYTCDGNASDYGQVYYRADGGPWTPVGLSKYNAKELWQFESIADPAFENVEDLQFGFRWVNNGGTSTESTSFSVDDVVLVATYDPVLNPIDIEITSLSPDPVCQASNLLLFWEISEPLCGGQYQIQLSAPGGTFPATPTSLGVFTIGDAATLGAVLTLPIPSTAVPNPCYRVRLVRVAPLPVIAGIASVCFEIQDCPNTITTLQPAVTLDSNAVCINSVIDVPFFSTGAFIAGNTYTAQLSDSTGSFASPVTIGTLSSSATFDPLLGSPPGTVSGLVPTVPPGCGYFIRVVSNIPSTIGAVWGPFCIQECDIETNEIEDIFVCITEETGVTVDVPIGVNIWESLIDYCDTNVFVVEVLETMFFTQVSYGELGLVVADGDTTVTITIPGLFDLLALGLDAGVWYMRIVSECSSDPENSLGTLIRLTIGAPADDPPTLTPAATLVCEGGLASFLVSPYNIRSRYQFQFLPGGTPFIWAFNPILVNLAGFTGELAIRVREINFGCPGPWSDTATIDVIDVPIVNITAPSPLCTGDTIVLSVPFFTETFYEWTVSGGTVTDTANNVIRMVFDEPGTYDVSIFGLNICGSGTGTKTLEVVASTAVDAGTDQTLCIGETITLDGSTVDILAYEWLLADTTASLNSLLTLQPDTSQFAVLFGTNAFGCIDDDTVFLTVEYPRTELRDSLPICPGGTAELDAGFPGSNYSWTAVPDGQTGQVVDVRAPGDYQVIVNSPDEACPITLDFPVYQVIDICEALLYVPNAFSPNGDGSNDYFTVYGQAVLEYQISVFNRWGQLLYTSNNADEVNNPSSGWDGRHKGELQEVGTYIYNIVAVGGDGFPVEKRGEIFLVR